jgi:subtilisin family serine protease
VYPFSSNSTYYNLGLSAIPVVPPTPPVPPIPPNGFSSVYGYGLINAAAAVARAIGQSTPFADVPNLGGNNWGNDLVNAPESWARGYTGQGVVVAVVDTGVDYNHVDLNDNIWVNTREIAGNGIDDDGNGYIDDVRGWDFVDRDNTPLDGGSHGTHVAGTIAAENNGLGVTGVAYNARIMAVRVLGPNGGTYQDVASGIRYAANNGANVINLSLGGGYSADIESAIQYASSRGSIVVMAAGNDGLSQPGNPARIATQYGLSVGAVDINRNIASFSNRAGSDSALQHIVAPGVNVYSTTPGNTYRFLNGTSMATPHVAGVIALMLSANRSLTPTQVRSIVTSSASRLSQSSTGSLGVNTVTGSNIPQGIGISVSSNLPDANSLNDFASLDYQTVTSGANPSTTNLTTPSQNVGLIQTTVSNVVSSESTRKPVSTSKPLNVARNILDIFGNEILDSSLVNQSDWVLGTI